MSNFKFTCPGCGQRILGDTGYVGREIPCPTCRQTLTIPQPGAAPVAPAHSHALASTIPLPVITTPVTHEPARLSQLAVASLICSLVPGVGSVPGIICGHLALARIHRNPTLRGVGVGTVGLVLGYFFLAATATWCLVKLAF